MSAYFMDLEGLLSRIDSASTYYQLLGVDRSAGLEEIKSSFSRLIDVLYPQYAINRNVPSEMSSRIERAFYRASQAFAALASFSKRKEYDTALVSSPSKQPAAGGQPKQRLDRQAATPSSGAGDGQSVSVPHTEINNDRVAGQSRAYVVSSTENRRRCARIRISLPARVTGHDRQSGKWQEMAETIDVSRTGARLRMRRKTKYGTVLHLTLPLPAKLRTHAFADASYSVYAFVRRVEPLKQGVRVVGLEFIGEKPPPGYIERPWSLFRVKRWGGSEHRRPIREDHVESLSLEYFDESMRSISREPARTENVSRYGVRIIGTTAPADFDFVMLSCDRLNFQALAALRSRYFGKDGQERLCLQLIDKEWPARSQDGG